MISDEVERALCVRLAEAIYESNLSRDAIITYEMLAKRVGESIENETFNYCVNLLATSPKVRLLDMHFLFFDPSDAEHIGEPIADNEVRAAIESGYLIDPRTGVQINDYKRHLEAYFTRVVLPEEPA